MKILLVPVGILKKYMRERELDINADCNAAALVAKLDLPDKLKAVCFINGKRIGPDYRFAAGDVVKIVSTFAGG